MLYHISFDVLETVEKFEPRIPENRMQEEDKTIKRVCCADTLEGAIMALPDNPNFLMSDKLFPLIKVYELDEATVKKDEFFTPSEIVDKVPDALATGEHWITTTIEPSNIYTIQVTSMKYDGSSRTIKELIYHKITKDEEDGISDYYTFGIKLEASEETLIILDEEIIDEDICDIDDLLSKAESIVRGVIDYISSEPVFRSTDIDNGLELYIEGYFLGEYRDRAFVHQEKEVIDDIKKELSILVSQYKLYVDFI
jgi:hypothetical protein